MNTQDLLTTCKIQKDNYPEEWGNCGELLIEAFESLHKECALHHEDFITCYSALVIYREENEKLRAIANAAKALGEAAWDSNLKDALKDLEDGTPL